MQWFRFYSEFASDPKVQSMPEDMQRRLVMLFCLQCDGSLNKLSHGEIAFHLRVTDETLHETFHVFQQKGFLDENNRLVNWDKRQFKSDTSTDRVKKFRDKSRLKQDETFLKRSETVAVTAPDTDTEKKKEAKASKKEFEIFWGAYPLKKGKGQAVKAFDRAIRKVELEVMLRAIGRYKLSREVQSGFVKHPATWLNGECWADDQATAQGSSPKPGEPYYSAPGVTPLGAGG